MPVTWNSEADARLLLGILEQVKGTKLDYKRLAEFMGPGCSVPAIQQRLFKLRREAGVSAANSPEKTHSAQSSPTSTPKKSKRAGGRSPETPIKRAKNISCDFDDNDNIEVAEKETKSFIKDEDEQKPNISFVDMTV